MAEKDWQSGGYDELRWLARSARKRYRWTIGLSTLGVSASMLLAIGVVALNPTESSDGGVVDLTDIEETLGRIEGQVGAIRNDELKDMPQIAARIEQVVNSLDNSDTTREELKSQLEGLLSRVDSSTWTRQDLRRQLERLTDNINFSHTTWLQSFADGPSEGIWRMYPMAPGDTLWIPDGNFFVRLVDATSSEILMQAYPDGQPLPGDPWPLQLTGYEQREVGNYSVDLYYARRRSIRPGFGGGAFLDVAICWSAAQDRCPERVPDYLLQAP